MSPSTTDAPSTRYVLTPSKDRIAYRDSGGDGPVMLLVDGACGHRGFGPLGSVYEAIEPHARVVHFDRRGRGESPKAAPKSLEQELADVDALIEQLAEPVIVFGVSSGAALALRIAARNSAVRGVAAFEPPFALDGEHTPQPTDFRERVGRALAEDDRDAAISIFMRTVGVPRFALWIMRLVPSVWPPLRAVAHTLPADFAALGETQSGEALPREWRDVLAAIDCRATVLVGGKSPRWMHHAAEVVAGAIEGGRVQVVPKATHTAGGKLLGPPLLDFIRGTSDAAAAQ